MSAKDSQPNYRTARKGDVKCDDCKHAGYYSIFCEGAGAGVGERDTGESVHLKRCNDGRKAFQGIAVGRNKTCDNAGSKL